MIKYILIINIITFLIYGVDKYLAYKEKNRISEKFLLTLALCFGIIGAVLGMKVFRHKTKKNSFKISITLIIIIIQLIIIYLVFTNKGILDVIINLIGIW